MLLAAGADLNAQTVEGETPLMTSVLYTYPMMFHLLIKEGASVDCSFKPEVAPLYCRTAFELAIALNFPEAVRILFDAGAQDNVLDHLEMAEEFYQLERDDGEIYMPYYAWDLRIHNESHNRRLNKEHLKQMIAQLISERPRSLKILCRKTIQTCLGQRIQKNIHKTGLPDPLIDYVLMKADLKEPQAFIWDGMTYNKYHGISENISDVEIPASTGDETSKSSDCGAALTEVADLDWSCSSTAFSWGETPSETDTWF